MKKIISILLVIIICVLGSSCAKQGDNSGRSGTNNTTKTVDDILSGRTKDTETEAPKQTKGFYDDSLSYYDGKIDIDLTKMTSVMIYSEVLNMVQEPDKHLGQVVKMNGKFTYGEGDDRYYFACVIPDATQCCSQGIEFILKNDRSFPDQYPTVGEDITVVGVFDKYFEGEYLYCQLIDAYIAKG